MKIIKLQHQPKRNASFSQLKITVEQEKRDLLTAKGQNAEQSLSHPCCQTYCTTYQKPTNVSTIIKD